MAMGNWAKAFIPKSTGVGNTTARGRKAGSHDTFDTGNLRKGSGAASLTGAYLRSNTVFKRASSLGTNGGRFRDTVMSFAPSMSVSMSFQYPLKSFLRDVDKKQKKVLYKTGGYARGLYRSKNDGYGTVKPLSKKGMSRRITPKTGEVSRTWQKAMDAQNSGIPRRPYRGDNDKLWKLTKFAVLMQEGTVLVGPELFRKDQLGVISAKPIPQLLDEGGDAQIVKKKRVNPTKVKLGNARKRQIRDQIPFHKRKHGPLNRVRKSKKKHTVEIVDVKYRAFPFRQNIKVKTTKRYKELFGEIRL